MNQEAEEDDLQANEHLEVSSSSSSSGGDPDNASDVSDNSYELRSGSIWFSNSSAYYTSESSGIDSSDDEEVNEPDRPPFLTAQPWLTWRKTHRMWFENHALRVRRQPRLFDYSIRFFCQSSQQPSARPTATQCDKCSKASRSGAASRAVFDSQCTPECYLDQGRESLKRLTSFVDRTYTYSKRPIRQGFFFKKQKRKFLAQTLCPL